jgi:hypothetical protein
MECTERRGVSAPEACAADGSARAADDRDAATAPSRVASWGSQEGRGLRGKVGSASRGVTVEAAVAGGGRVVGRLQPVGPGDDLCWRPGGVGLPWPVEVDETGVLVGAEVGVGGGAVGPVAVGCGAEDVAGPGFAAVELACCSGRWSDAPPPLGRPVLAGCSAEPGFAEVGTPLSATEVDAGAGAFSAGIPGTGSSAFGGIGPPAKLTASRPAYPATTAIAAIDARRASLRRRPETSTKTGAARVSEPGPEPRPEAGPMPKPEPEPEEPEPRSA